MPFHTLPLVVNYCSKHSNKPPGTPSKLIQILGGNCLFQTLSYAVSARQIYHTRVRAQIINYLDSSLQSYFVNCRIARNKVRIKGIIEILSAASLFSTDIFVYTQFWDTYKWQLEKRDPRKLTPVRVFNIN